MAPVRNGKYPPTRPVAGPTYPDSKSVHHRSADEKDGSCHDRLNSLIRQPGRSRSFLGLFLFHASLHHERKRRAVQRSGCGCLDPRNQHNSRLLLSCRTQLRSSTSRASPSFFQEADNFVSRWHSALSAPCSRCLHPLRFGNHLLRVDRRQRSLFLGGSGWQEGRAASGTAHRFPATCRLGYRSARCPPLSSCSPWAFRRRRARAGPPLGNVLAGVVDVELTCLPASWVSFATA